MIKQLKLERFKRFEYATVKFTPFTVLMGENSSGKTTILQAINLALVALSQNDFIVNDSAGHVKVRPKGVGLTRLPGIELSDFRELYFAKRSRASGGRKWVGANVDVQDEYGSEYRLQITSLFGGFNVKCVSIPKDLNTLSRIHRKPPLFISGFVGLSASEERIFPVALIDRLRTGHVSEVIRNLVFETKETAPDRYEALKKRLAEDFDFYLDDARFDAQKDIVVTAQYLERFGSNKASFDFNSSGSGFMQILQILAPIYRFCPDVTDVVLLDEPDAHLHPNLQTTLASSLRRISDELGIQIILSTHSTAIIRASSPAEIVPVTSGAQRCEPITNDKDLELEVRSKLDSYYLAKSIISGKLIFFEDTDTTIMERFDQVIGTKIFKGSNTAPIVRSRGKNDKVSYQLKEVFDQLINSTVEIIFIRDSDGIPPEWASKVQDYAKRKGVSLKILELFEMENYLLSASLIQRALSIKFKEATLPSTEMINEKILQGLKETITLSKYNYTFGIEEEIVSLARLIGDEEFRNPVSARSAAMKWQNSLEKDLSEAQLLKYGMGKETLSLILTWLNASLKLNLSTSDLISSISINDVPDEMREILSALRSKEIKESPVNVATFQREEEIDIEQQVDNLLFDFNPSGVEGKT